MERRMPHTVCWCVIKLSLSGQTDCSERALLLQVRALNENRVGYGLWLPPAQQKALTQLRVRDIHLTTTNQRRWSEGSRAAKAFVQAGGILKAASRGIMSSKYNAVGLVGAAVPFYQKRSKAGTEWSQVDLFVFFGM
jgi:hypothetical protein